MAAKASQQIGQTVQALPQQKPNFQPESQPQVQAQQQSKPLVQPAMKQSDWVKKLESDKAGAAANAEDFTKQFMSQMFGKEPSSVGKRIDNYCF